MFALVFKQCTNKDSMTTVYLAHCFFFLASPWYPNSAQTKIPVQPDIMLFDAILHCSTRYCVVQPDIVSNPSSEMKRGAGEGSNLLMWAIALHGRYKSRGGPLPWICVGIQ